MLLLLMLFLFVFRVSQVLFLVPCRIAVGGGGVRVPRMSAVGWWLAWIVGRQVGCCLCLCRSWSIGIKGDLEPMAWMILDAGEWPAAVVSANRSASTGCFARVDQPSTRILSSGAPRLDTRSVYVSRVLSRRRRSLFTSDIPIGDIGARHKENAPRQPKSGAAHPKRAPGSRPSLGAPSLFATPANMPPVLMPFFH